MIWLTNVTIGTLPSLQAITFKGIVAGAMITAWQWNTLIAFCSFPVGSLIKKFSIQNALSLTTDKNSLTSQMIFSRACV